MYFHEWKPLTAELWHCENQLNTIFQCISPEQRPASIDTFRSLGLWYWCHGEILNHPNTSVGQRGQCMITFVSMCNVYWNVSMMLTKYLPWTFHFLRDKNVCRMQKKSRLLIFLSVFSLSLQFAQSVSLREKAKQKLIEKNHWIFLSAVRVPRRFFYSKRHWCAWHPMENRA